MYSIFGKDTRFPPLSTAFKNGYRNVHPECRHHVSAWIEEFQTPEELQQAIDTSWQPFEDPRPEEDKALYNKQQKQNRQMRQDRYQHERYKARLGEDVPKTFSTFRRMKKAGGEHWVNLTAMYKHIGSLPPAMDATRYGKMVMIALKKQGVQVIHVKGDDAAFLRALNAEAMLMGNTHILHLQKVPSASAFFEEIIHLTQNRKLCIINSTDFIARDIREIQANKKLLANAKTYRFTQKDMDDVANNLKSYLSDYKRRTGRDYE